MPVRLRIPICGRWKILLRTSVVDGWDSAWDDLMANALYRSLSSLLLLSIQRVLLRVLTLQLRHAPHILVS